MEHVRIPNAALVLVSDGRRARFLRNKGTPLQPELIVERTLEVENPPTREQGTDRPGRKHQSSSTARSAVEQTDWHQRAEEHFASRIADELYRMGHSDQFLSLVVVAPPKMLGDLRTRLHPEVSDCVIAEVAKDLTGHSVPEIGRLLS